MKRNEDAVIPIVDAMMNDIRIVLDMPQQWTLSQWALAKAMVHEYMSSNRDRFYGDIERAALREFAAISPFTFVYVNSQNGRANLDVEHLTHLLRGARRGVIVRAQVP